MITLEYYSAIRVKSCHLQQPGWAEEGEYHAISLRCESKKQKKGTNLVKQSRRYRENKRVVAGGVGVGR